MRQLFISLLACVASATSTTTARDGFAIVIDPESHRQAQSEVAAYARALEEVQGFRVYTIEDRWGVPDSIRAELQRLHALRTDPIVGAVFVGDIPVPMIRDAQFLTSAFKMSQSMPWRDSSVPSDRFYDDFHLSFRYLQRDTVQWSHLFYYTLTADGSQRLHPDIFTGRIRPTDTASGSRYDKLRAYLRKAVAAKRNPEAFHSVFTYTGSGSVNESRVAHIDEQRSMHDHVPTLPREDGRFSYMDYADQPFIKRRLMNEMMRPDLSLGIMHHHGDFDTQYLTHAPKPAGTEQALQYLLRSYRDRLRRAERYGQDVDSIRRMLTARDSLPATWLAGEPSAANNRLDSLLEDSLNLTLKDFATYAYRPNCRFAIYDACYNAAFHNADCIANEYIFQPGKTIAGMGGTVNVIQDKWPDRYVGLLAEGVMVGLICQHQPELELHIVGDPTFCFRPQAKDPGLNALILHPRTKAWQKLLAGSTHPDVQCMALEMLNAGGTLTDGHLLRQLTEAPSGLVRLEAFMLLQQRNSPLLTEAIRRATTDGFELLQRMAVNAIQHSGHPDLAPPLARLIARDNTSARVAFNAREVVQFLPPAAITEAAAHALDSIAPYVTWPDEYRQQRLATVKSYSDRWESDIRDLCDGKMSPRRARVQADRMKIYLPPYLIPDVAAYTERCDDAELQVLLLATLGWHRLAYTAKAIGDVAQRMSQNQALPEQVRAEALKTLKRIQ
ncbi:MAG: HEAT repeat domain-containing protein [Bacteroidaceae bacterium]|nr:HEAT repeat domain-containing protein [Bacteroidaceae bacterium]